MLVLLAELKNHSYCNGWRDVPSERIGTECSQ